MTGWQHRTFQSCSSPTRKIEDKNNTTNIGKSVVPSLISTQSSNQAKVFEPDAVLLKLIKQWSSLREDQVKEIQNIIEKSNL